VKACTTALNEPLAEVWKGSPTLRPYPSFSETLLPHDVLPDPPYRCRGRYQAESELRYSVLELKPPRVSRSCKTSLKVEGKTPKSLCIAPGWCWYHSSNLDFTRHPRIMYSVLQQMACISSKDAMNDDLVDERKGLDGSLRVRVCNDQIGLPR